jgi:hypothetical protein
MSIKQQYQKWFLSLYRIDDNMHPQKQRFEVSHENVIENLNISNQRTMNN